MNQYDETNLDSSPTIILEKQLNSKLKSSYRISMVAIAALVVMGIPHLSEGREMLFRINVGVAIIIALASVLILRGFHNIGRTLLILFICVACMSFYIPFGKSVHLPYFFIGPLVINYLIHLKSESKRMMVLSFFAYAFLFIGFFLIGDNYKMINPKPVSAFFTAFILLIGFHITLLLLKKEETSAINDSLNAQESLKGFKSAISQSSSMAVLDIHANHVLESNKGFKELMNLLNVSSVKDLLKKSIVELEYDDIKSSVDRDGYWNGFFEFYENSHYRYFQATVSRVNKDFFVLILFDNTESKIQESKNEKLQFEMDLAIKEASFKANFLSSMSHEIRTPLNGVIGVLQVLKEEKEESKRNELIDIMDNSSNILLNLINDVLDISKIQAGKLNVNYGVYDLKHQINLTKSLYTSLARKKSIDLNIEYVNEFNTLINSDSTRVSQVLNNLVSNAIKFTEENGKVDLLIQKKGESLRFEVKDNGLGISQEGQTKLFGMFFQEESENTSSSLKGTGLGLAICRELVSLLKGEIGVISVLGEGSTFWFEIPYEIGDLKGIDNKKEGLKKNVENKSVLVVEDNLVNQKVAGLILNSLGCDAEFAGNGEDGVRKASKNEYDLIFMDIQMPVMDGVKAMKKLKQSGYKKPIIALSANAMEGDKEVYIRKGFDDYTSKPIKKDIIHSVLSTWID